MPKKNPQKKNAQKNLRKKQCSKFIREKKVPRKKSLKNIVKEIHPLKKIVHKKIHEKK